MQPHAAKQSYGVFMTITRLIKKGHKAPFYVFQLLMQRRENRRYHVDR